jgi:hypothetical protein
MPCGPLREEFRAWGDRELSALTPKEIKLLNLTWTWGAGEGRDGSTAPRSPARAKGGQARPNNIKKIILDGVSRATASFRSVLRVSGEPAKLAAVGDSTVTSGRGNIGAAGVRFRGLPGPDRQ